LVSSALAATIVVCTFAGGYLKPKSGAALASSPIPAPPELRIQDCPTFKKLGFREVRGNGGCFLSDRILATTWKSIVGYNEHVMDGYVDDATYSEVVDFSNAVGQALQNEFVGSSKISVVEEKILFGALDSNGVSFSSGGVWVKKEGELYSRFIQVGGPQRQKDDRLGDSQRPSRYGKKPIYILLELKMPQKVDLDK
jgi:hypothetical protein